MINSCEWVLPTEPKQLICLGPEHMGKSIASLLELWSIDTQGLSVHNWYEPIDISTSLAPGMRISFLSPLKQDPKAKRKIDATKK